MPEISRFFGIVLSMFHREHEPPHFHANYGGYSATIGIDDGAVIGEMPPRALRLIQEWRELYHEQLLDNWSRARDRLPLNRIPPLE